MKRNYIKFIMMVCVGGVLLLPAYCPEHHKVDDCLKTSSPYGDNKGHK